MADARGARDPLGGHRLDGSMLERPRVPRFGHGSRVPGWDRAADLDKDPATVPDADEVDVPAELRAEIEARMADYPDRRSAALSALTAAQRLHGWCSPEAITQAAAVMRVTPAYLESVATFYDMLETEPAPRHNVYVCTNISCSLLGADRIHRALHDAVAAEEEDVNVRSFECLGACDIAPMASVDGVYVGPLSEQDIPRMLTDIRAERPVLPDLQLARRLATDPRANSREFPEHPAEQATAATSSRAAAATSQPGAASDEDRAGASAAIEPEAELGQEPS